MYRMAALLAVLSLSAAPLHAQQQQAMESKIASVRQRLLGAWVTVDEEGSGEDSSFMMFLPRGEAQIRVVQVRLTTKGPVVRRPDAVIGTWNVLEGIGEYKGTVRLCADFPTAETVNVCRGVNFYHDSSGASWVDWGATALRRVTP
jgi:hypothetical protein